MGEFTRLLKLSNDGDTEAQEALVVLVYDELKRIAANKLANERAGHTLQVTELANMGLMRIAETDGKLGKWNSSGHFFSAFAEAVRRILVENARRKRAQKRGAGAEHTEFDESKIECAPPGDEILRINDALSKLEVENPEVAMIVKWRFHAGYTYPEISKLLGIPERTLVRKFEGAKTWLYCELERSD